MNITTLGRIKNCYLELTSLPVIFQHNYEFLERSPLATQLGHNGIAKNIHIKSIKIGRLRFLKNII